MGAPGEPPAQEGGDDAADQSISPRTSHMAAGLCQNGTWLLIMACRSGMAAPLT